MGNEMKLYVFIFLAICLILFSILYVFSTFTYHISNTALSIQWRLFRYIPFNSREINIEEVLEVRRFDLSKDLLVGTQIWGNLLIRKGVVLVLKRGFFRHAYVTPKDPDNFIQEMKARIDRL